MLQNCQLFLFFSVYAMPLLSNIPFRTIGFDRRPDLRKSVTSLKTLLDVESTKFICFYKGKPLICLQPQVSIGFVDKQPVGNCFFVGVRKGKAIFAVSTATPQTAGKHIDLRSIGGSLPPEDLSLLGYCQSLLKWHASNLFCQRCGLALSFDLSGEKRWCQSCTVDVFPRINPVVIALVCYENKLLLGRQSSFPKGMYSCLAGFVELGEGIEDTVAREVQEEVGLPVSQVEYLGSQPWPFPAQLMMAFVAHVSHQVVEIDTSELEDARWFSISELKEMCSGRSRDGFFIPPSIAIARQMVMHFIEHFDSR